MFNKNTYYRKTQKVVINHTDPVQYLQLVKNYSSFVFANNFIFEHLCHFFPARP